MVTSTLRNPKGRDFWLQPREQDPTMKRSCMICGQCVVCGEYKGFLCAQSKKRVLQMWEDWISEDPQHAHVHWWFLMKPELIFVSASVCTQCQEQNDARC